MKFRLLFTIILAALVVGCQHKEVDFNPAANTRSKIYAVIEDIDTKTSLSEDNQVLWSEDDEISAFLGKTSGDRFIVDAGSAGSASALFEFKEAAQGGESLDAYAAYYPYSSTLSISKQDGLSYEVSGISLPEVQIYSEKSFGKGTFPMFALEETAGESLKFRNICGGIKIRLTGTKAVRSMTIKGSDGERLSGEATLVAYADGTEPEMRMTDNSGTSVTLDCGTEGVQLDSEIPVPFIISLPPTIFENGFTVSITDVDGGEMNVSAGVRNQVFRSSLLSMPVLEYIAEEPQGVSVTIEETSVTVDDIKIRVNIENAVQYSGGFKLKSKFNVADVVKDANWKIAPRMTDSFLFEGSLSQFPAGEFKQLSHGQKYVVWVAPYMKDQKTVKAEDIVYKEFSLPELQSGSNVEVNLKETIQDYKSVEVVLSAPGAVMVYASILTESEIAALTDSESRVSYLFGKSTPKTGESVSVSRDKLESGEALKVLAMAVDAEGRYGSVYEFDAQTSVPVYNEDIVIDMSISYSGRVASIKVNSTGADIDYYYYFCSKKTDSYWTRDLGGSRQSAEEFMAVNPDCYFLDNTRDIPLKDGCVEISQIDMEDEYVFVIMAVDKEGKLSRAFMMDFISHMDLGEFVYKKDSSLWYQTQPEITFGKCKGEGGFYLINWSVQPAEGMTAYTACLHPNTLADCTTPEEMVVRIYNFGVQVVPGKMETMVYGDKGDYIYVIWCDAEGNFFEPLYEPVPQH